MESVVQRNELLRRLLETADPIISVHLEYVFSTRVNNSENESKSCSKTFIIAVSRYNKLSRVLL